MHSATGFLRSFRGDDHKSRFGEHFDWAQRRETKSANIPDRQKKEPEVMRNRDDFILWIYNFAAWRMESSYECGQHVAVVRLPMSEFGSQMAPSGMRNVRLEIERKCPSKRRKMISSLLVKWSRQSSNNHLITVNRNQSKSIKSHM